MSFLCLSAATFEIRKGYAMSDDQVLDRGREATENGRTEMHTVGVHHQGLTSGIAISSRNLERELPTDSPEALDRSRNQLV